MYAKREKPKENKNRAVSHSVIQNKSKVKQVLVMDNRPERILQKEPLQMNGNNKHAMHRTQSNVIQQVKITTTKGTILDSVANEQYGKPGAKEKRGQISGGIKNVGGTPGSPYAKNVKTWTRTADWLGGHIYKHQWGGGITRGNVVVWPSAAEARWEGGFEDRVQEKIDQGEKVAIGVSWTINDELIPPQAPSPEWKGHPNEKYITDTLEVDRRNANDALSYIPEVAAGHVNDSSVVIGASTSKVNDAKRDAITYLHQREQNNLQRLEKIDPLHKDKLLGSISSKLGGAANAVSVEKFGESHADEDLRKGRFGNLSLEVR